MTEALAELLAEGAPDPEALPLAEAEEVPLLVEVAAGAARRRKSYVRPRRMIKHRSEDHGKPENRRYEQRDRRNGVRRMRNGSGNGRTAWGLDVEVGAGGEDLAVVLRAHELDLEARADFQSDIGDGEGLSQPQPQPQLQRIQSETVTSMLDKVELYAPPRMYRRTERWRTDRSRSRCPS